MVAPSSAPMLMMVARSGTVRDLTPAAAVFDDLAHAALTVNCGGAPRE